MQNYKYRKAPWIKVYGGEILNDLLYCSLPIEAKALLIPLWALAAESYSGVFDSSLEQLSFRIRGFSATDIDLGVAALISAGFFIDAIGEEIDVMVPISPAAQLKKAEKAAEKIAEKQAKADIKAAKKLANAQAKAEAKQLKMHQALAEIQIDVPKVTTTLDSPSFHRPLNIEQSNFGTSWSNKISPENVSIAADF